MYRAAEVKGGDAFVVVLYILEEVRQALLHTRAKHMHTCMRTYMHAWNTKIIAGEEQELGAYMVDADAAEEFDLRDAARALAFHQCGRRAAPQTAQLLHKSIRRTAPVLPSNSATLIV